MKKSVFVSLSALSFAIGISVIAANSAFASEPDTQEENEHRPAVVATPAPAPAPAPHSEARPSREDFRSDTARGYQNERAQERNNYQAPRREEIISAAPQYRAPEPTPAPQFIQSASEPRQEINPEEAARRRNGRSRFEQDDQPPPQYSAPEAPPPPPPVQYTPPMPRQEIDKPDLAPPPRETNRGNRDSRVHPHLGGGIETKPPQAPPIETRNWPPAQPPVVADQPNRAPRPTDPNSPIGAQINPVPPPFVAPNLPQQQPPRTHNQPPQQPAPLNGGKFTGRANPREGTLRHRGGYYDNNRGWHEGYQSGWTYNYSPTFSWEYNPGRGWQSFNDSPRYSQSDDFSKYDRPNYDRRGFDFSSHSGRNFMGPYGNWSRWDNSWGDANYWARRWGFDSYDASRGWRRGTRWYRHPSQWADWGGWFSYFFSSNSLNQVNYWGFSYNNYSFDPYYQQYFSQYGTNCMRLYSQDLFQDERVDISFVACQTRYGTWQEVPNTRQLEDNSY